MLEEPFKDQYIQISNDNEECTSWLIYDFMTRFLVMDTLDTFTCRKRNKKSNQKTIVDDKFIISFDGIVPNNQHVNIFQNNYSKLARHCVTLKNMFDNHFKETEYTDVIC